MAVTTDDIRLPEGTFSREDILEAIGMAGDAGGNRLRTLIPKLLAEGRMTRVGHGLYAASGPAGKTEWAPPYSPAASEAAGAVAGSFPLLDFRVWELMWLNEFLNHLAARNTVFVCVEREGCEFVFETLRDRFPGRVLLKPTPDEAARYGTDGGISVVRLVSEAPRSGPERHRAAIEQVAVDMFADKLIRSLLPQGDYAEAYRAMFERYAIDQVALLRYARRRGKEDELRDFLADEAAIGVLSRKAAGE